jgi:ABC-type sugar transport system substrate-binding protein
MLGRRHPRAALALGLFAVSVAIVATSSIGASAGLSARAGTKATCGTIPTLTPKDPGRLLNALPASMRAAYNGYSGTIVRSRWKDWKPKGKPPYVVGVTWGSQSNPFQIYVFKLIQKFLKKSPLVKDVVAATVISPSDLSGQINNYQSAIQQGAVLMVSNFTNPNAGAPYISQAADRGIPTVNNFSGIESRDSVDLQPNDFAAAAKETASIVKSLGGKGNVLFVHGVRSVGVDVNAFAGAKSVLEDCPNMKVVGELDGLFSPPIAKQVVLQYLSTHSEKIDYVVQSAAMSSAIISAFEQAGRPVPAIMMNFSDKGSLAYWRDNKSKGYNAVGSLIGPTAVANLITRMATRMLAGQGMQYSDLPISEPLVTSANLAQLVKPTWKVGDTAVAEQPKSTWWTNKELDRLVKHPKLIKGVTR